MKDVSIIIPVFNRAPFLPRLFDSLRQLTYPAVQVIFVDNGSRDESLPLCQAFAAKASFPVVVTEEKKAGASAARNKGLTLCQTEWVYFFDSDDEVSPDFLDALMPLAEGGGTPEQCADMVVFGTNMVIDGKCSPRAFVASPKPSDAILSLSFTTQSMLLRTAFLRQCGGWDETLSTWDDWELGIRLLLHHPRIQWYKAHSFHHIYLHEESQTGRSFTSTLPAICQAVRAVEKELTDARDQHALMLRCRIVEGQLKREGTTFTFPLTAQSTGGMRLLGGILKLYAAHGGRGAWRVALSLL